MKYPVSLFLLAVLVLLSGCSPGTQGIFASIEREQKVQSLGGINKYATITSMAELTSVSPHVYFATGGQALFTRTYGTINWNKTTVGGYSQIAAVGSVGTSSTATTAVYAVAGGALWKTVDGSNWSQVSGLAASDIPSSLIPIRSSDGYSNTELLLVTYQSLNGQPNYLNVYRIQDTAGISPAGSVNLLNAIPAANRPDGLSSDVSSAVYDPVQNRYYMVSQSYLWSIDSAFASATQVGVSITDNTTPHNFQGLLYYNSVLYLSTMSNDKYGGSLYAASSPSGSIFSFATLTSTTSLNSSPVWFTQFLYNTRNVSLWIATYATTYYQGSGYMEYTLGTSSFSKSPNTDQNNYNSTVLPTSAVGVLFADNESAPNYFLGTLSEGLWQWSGSGSSATWVQQ